MQVKICGITNCEDAELAVACGANFIGLNFVKQSPRYIDVATARSLLSVIAPAKAVAIFLGDDQDTIAEVCQQLPFYAVQTYHPLSISLPCKTIFAVRLKAAADLQHLNNMCADYYLLDSYHSQQYGGTGLQFNWQWLPEHRQQLFLAGGIHPDNVREAKQLQPFAIDVCSGIEKSPGIKDPIKLKKLFAELATC